MERINKKMKMVLISLSILLLGAIGLTIAYYNSQKDFKNEFHVSAPGVSMYEDFNPADKWVPDEEKGKQAWFTNTGELDMLLRFTIEAKWKQPPTDANGAPLKDKNGQDIKEGSVVSSDILTLYWQDSQNDPEKGYHQAGIDNEAQSYLGAIKLEDAYKYPEFDFKVIVDPEDGKTYYYYKKVLKAKGSDMSSTQHVLESVKFDPHLSNDGHINSNYSNTQIDLTIKGETVLVDERAVAEQWPNVTVSFIYDQEGDITAVDWNRKEN